MEIIISKECKLNMNDIPVFAYPEFLDLKGQEYGYIYGLINQEIHFFCAFVLKKKYFFCVAEFQTPVICVREDYEDYSQEFLECGLQELYKKYNVDFVCQNPAYAISDIYPSGAQYSYFGSFICNLNDSEEELWNKVHSKHRNVIRKARSNGVEIKFNEYNINAIYDLILATQTRSDNNFLSKAIFVDLIERMQGRVDVVSAHSKGELQGCAIIAYDARRAYYLYGGSCSKTSPGALNLMHWEAMLHYKDKGLAEYDYVGARLSGHISNKLHGIQRFKSRFGGELYKGFLWKFIFKEYKYNLYKLLYYIKNHKWEVDAIDEEHITDI